jgi:hypothetical protein
MNLYRIDPAERIDPLWRTLRGEQGAIRVAQARAKRLGRDVTVSRIDGRTLRVAPVYTVQPNAQARRIA